MRVRALGGREEWMERSSCCLTWAMETSIVASLIWVDGVVLGRWLQVDARADRPAASAGKQRGRWAGRVGKDGDSNADRKEDSRGILNDSLQNRIQAHCFLLVISMEGC